MPLLAARMRINAIQKESFQFWPGLTTLAVHKYLPKSEATSKGHLDQIRRNLRATKTHDDHDDEMEPTQVPNNDATYYQLFAFIENTGKI